MRSKLSALLEQVAEAKEKIEGRVDDLMPRHADVVKRVHENLDKVKRHVDEAEQATRDLERWNSEMSNFPPPDEVKGS
jgi:hypothetical protein